jgi:carbon storage regulator CsrA
MGAILGRSQGSGVRGQAPTADSRKPKAESGQYGNLVVSRRANERIVLRLEDGRVIRITVCDFRHGPKGAAVRLHISAPRSISVHREEIDRRILELAAQDALGVVMPREVFDAHA